MYVAIADNYRGEEAMLAEIGALTLQERMVKDRLAELHRTILKSLLGRLAEDDVKSLGGAPVKVRLEQIAIALSVTKRSAERLSIKAGWCFERQAVRGGI